MLYEVITDGKIVETGHLVEGIETIVVLDRRFETEYEFRLLVGHPKHIIAVVTADIGHFFTLEIEIGTQKIIFLITAPFGIDKQTEQISYNFV